MADLETLVKEATATSQKMPQVISGAELMEMEFPEPTWLVDVLIPTGLTILAGPPKRGKSWFALELALAVCSGEYFLDRKAQSGCVLYCALEDSPRRFRDRLKKQGWSKVALNNLNVIFGRQFHEMFGGKDGLKDFIRYIKANKYTLIILDTISRAFAVRDWNDQAAVTAVLGPLQQAVSDSGRTLLLIDHHKKRNGFDPNPVEDVLGSVAKSGVADTIIALYREQGKLDAKLAIVGRDVEEQTLELRFAAFTGCWTEVASGDGLTDIQQETIRAIQLRGGFATLSELVDATRRNRGTLYRELITLQQRGLVIYERRQWRTVGS